MAEQAQQPVRGSAFNPPVSSLSPRMAPWRTRHVPCALCGSLDFEEVYPSTLLETVERPLDELCACTSSSYGVYGAIVRCTRCGLLLQNPQPDPEDLLAAYAQVVDARYDEEREGRVRTFRSNLQELERHTQPGRLLDIGSHLGFFVEVARDAGWDALGIEPSRWAAETAQRRGLLVLCSSLEEVAESPSSFDAVTLWDVIEHLPAPADALRRIFELLSPGGVVALSTMDVDAPVARLLGRRWPWYMPMHLFYFSRRTLRLLLEAVGYEVLEIRRHRRIVRVAYLVSRLERRLGRWYPMLVRVVESLGLGNRLVGIDLGDIVSVYARKPLSARPAHDGMKSEE